MTLHRTYQYFVLNSLNQKKRLLNNTIKYFLLNKKKPFVKHVIQKYYGVYSFYFG